MVRVYSTVSKPILEVPWVPCNIGPFLIYPPLPINLEQSVLLGGMSFYITLLFSAERVDGWPTWLLIQRGSSGLHRALCPLSSVSVCSVYIYVVRSESNAGVQHVFQGPVHHKK